MYYFCLLANDGTNNIWDILDNTFGNLITDDGAMPTSDDGKYVIFGSLNLRSFHTELDSFVPTYDAWVTDVSYQYQPRDADLNPIGDPVIVTNVDPENMNRKMARLLKSSATWRGAA